MDRSTDGAFSRRAVASEATRIAALLLAIAAISLLHATTDQSEVIWHGLLLRLYYLPILIGAYWYGAFGGLLVALASSLAYVPHLQERSPAFEAGRYAEIVVFHLIGLTVGLLATSQRRVTARYQLAAATLEAANTELKASYGRALSGKAWESAGTATANDRARRVFRVQPLRVARKHPRARECRRARARARPGRGDSRGFARARAGARAGARTASTPVA